VADLDFHSVVPAVAEVLEVALAVEHHRQLQALLVEPLHSGVQFPSLAVDVGLDVDSIQGLAVAEEVPVCDSGLDTVLADSTRQVAALLVLKKEADGFGGGFNVLVDSVHGQILQWLHCHRQTVAKGQRRVKSLSNRQDQIVHVRVM